MYLFTKSLVISGVLVSHHASSFAVESKPNIIFILMDDIRYSDISCYDVKMVSAPTIARPADELFYYFSCENLQAVQAGDWKLCLPRKKQQIPIWSQSTRKFMPADRPQLYNITTEKAEKMDKFSDNSEMVVHMLALAEETHKKFGVYKQSGRGAGHRLSLP